MEPFDTIEKWINEHGSAAILRDHVALLKDQHAEMKKRVVELTDELARSKARIQELEQEGTKKVESLERKIRDLEGIVRYQQQTVDRQLEGPDLPPGFPNAGD
jgi:predicted RNase H-like nuclease (RuvC/YqgF family)